MSNILVVDKVIGIKCRNPVIYDSYGEFYKREGIKHINLPKGKYSFYSPIGIICEPIIYKLPALPFREKIYRIPKISDITIEYIDGLEQTARIDISRNLIQMNSNMLKATTPQYYSVFYHELGHYLYYNETKCDIFAIRQMLINGFNPSQISDFIEILPGNVERKNIIFNVVKKVDGFLKKSRGIKQ